MKNRERGAVTLLVSLTILLIMTMLVLSTININTINFRIAGNMQAQKMVETAALQGMENVMSQTGNFASTSTAQTIIVGDYSVSIIPSACIGTKVMSGFSAAWGMSPEENVWEMEAQVSDPLTGASITLHQGVKIQQLADSCSP
jgi:Tfp pilus assembly protein PilX